MTDARPRFYTPLILCILLNGCSTADVGTAKGNSAAEMGGRTDGGGCGKTYQCLVVFSEVLTQIQKNYIEDVDIQVLVYAAIQGMLKPLDSQSSFIEPDSYHELKDETKGQFGGPGFQLGVRDGRVVVISPIDSSPAAKAGIQPGDYLTKVEEEPTTGMTLLEVIKKLNGPQGSKVTVTLERENASVPLIYTLDRVRINANSIVSRVIKSLIGYVRITQFQTSTSKDLNLALKQLRQQQIRGLILDLRNNPGGLLTASIEVAEQFIEANKVLVTLKGRGITGKSEEYLSKHKDVLEGLPLIILVNSGSASGSEIVAGALQDWGRAMIVGTPSFGRGNVQTILPLSDGSGLRLTTAVYYTPKGRPINQQSKIQPDSIIEEREGQDLPLSFAIDQLLGKMGA
jgi:carboxyl-terminal processing protease